MQPADYNGTAILTDTSAAGWTLTLPTAPADDTVVGPVVDAKGSWGAHTLVIAAGGSDKVVDPNGVGTTGATATSVNATAVRASITLLYDAVQSLWHVI